MSPPERSPIAADLGSKRCPKCGRADAVTVERVVTGATAINQCHCRACGASWADPAQQRMRPR